MVFYFCQSLIWDVPCLKIDILLILQYLAFVIVIWMSELVIGMLSYTYMDEVRSDLSRNLVKPIQRYYHVRNPDEKFNQHVDFIQTRVSLIELLKCI